MAQPYKTEELARCLSRDGYHTAIEVDTAHAQILAHALNSQRAVVEMFFHVGCGVVDKLLVEGCYLLLCDPRFHLGVLRRSARLEQTVDVLFEHIEVERLFEVVVGATIAAFLFVLLRKAGREHSMPLSLVPIHSRPLWSWVMEQTSPSGNRPSRRCPLKQKASPKR